MIFGFDVFFFSYSLYRFRPISEELNFVEQTKINIKKLYLTNQTNKMRSIAISIILLGYIVTISKCEQAYETNALDFDGLATDVDKDSFLKRMERRAYTYMTGVPGSKRLPNYNFGLGKRARYENGTNLPNFCDPFEFNFHINWMSKLIFQ